MKSRFNISLVLILGIIGILIFSFFYFKNLIFKSETILNQDVMVSKITNMGKLELVKYSMKDVVEKKQTRRVLPDQRILFVAVGEVAGCIDLTKVKKSDIQFGEDSIIISLPAPEICYSKIDHQKSKVYDVSGVWFPSDTKDMVEDIYKIAEQQLIKSANEMQILSKTKENAKLIFKPLIENFSGKRVGILFK
ncbi:MAG: DUF4230 domain-containing protein [Bacteroidetes bacterium]|nr:DUF4230 domain-containing protein [Bacteroidota bacterium]MBU1372190.1 DUF4230 domain-containing protein [Bacteroidota bacterium]MBU1483332.1 DUF4230 domain-containing protein [Bacteroidota bacterium]MBU1760348.1 DUF4230 domain-containing protein [Bacteroidota bacterium]MBU2267626.1 DUF4230 domain-containing protein [Bacteroidota bacterium]